MHRRTPMRNRVTPTGEIVAVELRGAWLGNRGILHRGTGFRLQAVGLLVMNTAKVVSMLAHLHSHGIFPVLFVGFAFFAGGLVVSAKERRTVER